MYIFDFIMQDHNGNYLYPQTAKNRISGMFHPDCYIENSYNYRYFNVFTIEYGSDTGFVNETFTISLIKNPTKEKKSETYEVHLEGIIYDNTFVLQAFTYRSLNHIYNMDDDSNNLISYIIEGDQIDNDGNAKKVLKLWVNILDYKLICVQRISSFSDSAKFDNRDKDNMIDSNYNVEYFNNNTIKQDNHVINTINISDNKGKAEDITKNLLNSIDDIYDRLDATLSTFKYCSVTYDSNYYPIQANIDEIISATNINVIDYDFTNPSLPIALMPENIGEYIEILESGRYQLSLKISMKILNGKTDMNMALYKNDTRLEDSSTILHLDFNNQSTVEGFITGNVVLDLMVGDKIYLKNRSTNLTIDIVNSTKLQITQLSKYR